jgi:RNA polymerase sigma-70 factor (ECF subfamily)
MTSSNFADHTDLPEPSPHDVAAAAAGDCDAFRRIVERYQGMVYTMAYNLLGNHIDAEDASQEAFLRLHQKLSGFRGYSTFTTWFFRLALNAIIDYQRRDRKYGALPDVPEPVVDPVADVLRRDGYARVVRALGDLPPDYRLPLVLRDLYGLRYAEISDALDRPLGTIKACVHRGRTSLRLRLKASGALDGDD